MGWKRSSNIKDDQAITNIKRDILRYQRLRRHAETGHEYRHNLERLQKFQSNRMHWTHRSLLIDPDIKEVLDFFLDEMYGGIDLNHLSGEKIEGAIILALKLVRNSCLLTSSLEFNALTGELDEEICLWLFEKMKVTEITNENYAEANHQANTYARRLRQIELILELSEGLDKNTKSRTIYGALKLAKGPAKLGGVSGIHNLIFKAYSVLRRVQSPELLIAQIVDQERRYQQSLFMPQTESVGMECARAV